VYAIFTSKGNDDMSKDKISVGLFGIGLDTYWPQFEGLKERLEGYQEDIAREILKNDAVNLVNVGLVDNPKRAATVGSLFRQKQVDIIFLYISTYALSSTVLPVAQEAGGTCSRSEYPTGGGHRL
jgi:L-arabinose isomerase